MKMIIYFVLMGLIICTARASETVSAKIEKLEYSIQLPKPFNKISIGAGVDNKNGLTGVYAKGESVDINVNEEHLSLYNKVSLSSIKIYEGNISNKSIDANGKIGEYTINDFSLCLEYGESKKGVRVNKEGWYKNSLRIVFKKTGEYELINTQVEQQRIPDGICIQ